MNAAVPKQIAQAPAPLAPAGPGIGVATGAPVAVWHALAAVMVMLAMGCGGSGSSSSPTAGTGGSGRGGAGGVGGMGHPQGGGGAGGRPAPGTGGNGGMGTAAGGRGGGMTGAAGSSGAAGGASAGTGGAGGAGPGCFLGIQAVAPTSFSIEAGPGVTMRVQGHSSGTAATLIWSWTVTYADGNGTQIRTRPVDLDGAAPGTVVEFPVENPGLYQIAASVTGDFRCSITTQVLTAVASSGASFIFRTTAAQYPVQETVVRASDPGHVLPLSLGLPIAVTPVDDVYGLLLPSYVRITSPGTSFRIEGDTTRTPFAALLLPHLTYDVLIAPQGALAPLLLSLTADEFGWKPIVDPGIDVHARTLAADGSPVANARLLLKRGTVPSTLGVSDASGLLTVQTRPGSLTATIVPPDGSGFPVATTNTPFDLGMTGAPALTMRWDDLPSATLAVQVVRPDGVTPVGHAQVWLYSALFPYRAGVLAVGDALALEALASVAASATTGDDGVATFPPYPAGPYQITVLPPESADPAAVTTVAANVPAGAAAQKVTLASKVKVTGALLPLPASAGALIRAVDSGTPALYYEPGTPPTGGSVSTQTAADGSFTLFLSPNRDYELILQPPSNASGSVGRAVKTMRLGASSANMGVITLPPGQPYQGTVMLLDSTTPRAVAGAFIQVYCAGSSVNCADPTVSLAEATSRGDGTFSLILPQPGPSLFGLLGK